jgi:hypothetical protein
MDTREDREAMASSESAPESPPESPPVSVTVVAAGGGLVRPRVARREGEAVEEEEEARSSDVVSVDRLRFVAMA